MTNTPEALEKQRAERRAFVAAGLTIYGTRRKNYQWPELAGLTGRERMNERIRICTNRARLARRQATGRDRPAKQPAVRLVGWRDSMVNSLVLLAEVEAAVASINAIYEKLDPVAKAKSLELGHTLAGMRRKLTRV